MYKHEPNVPEITQRRLARLAAIFEEADEAFGEEIKNISKEGKKKEKHLLPSSNIPLTHDYMHEYSNEILGKSLTDQGARYALFIAEAIGVKTVSQFEELMASTLEALMAAFSDIQLVHLRALSFYIGAVGVWANAIESPFVPTQQSVLNEYRDLVHEELFQSVIKQNQ